MVTVKRLSLVLAAIVLVASVAEARRGFSSSGSGKGRYSSDSSTSSWNVNSTLDADCQAQFGKPCSELTTGQYEIVQQKYTQATDAGYASNTDYETASANGYGLTSSDGTLWASAKSWGDDSSQNSDCNSAYSGDCDAISKANFNAIYDGRQDALDTGFTGYGDWLDAEALGYAQDNTTDDADLGADTSDSELWAEAKGNSIQTACQAEDSTVTNCNELTRTQYKDAKQGNALLAAKKTIVTAGNLAASDLSELLGSDWASSSALSSSPSAWQLDYLETVLGTGANVTKSDWQSTIDNYDAATASAWYIWKIAASSDSSGTYAASNANYALFDAANVDSGLSGLNSACSTGGSISSGKTCATLGVTDTQIAANIRSAGFTAAPSATAMRDFLTEARGFADGTTYASVATATGNSWTVANYVTATSNGGWTSSSADATKFSSCKTNTSASTGGAGSCSATSSGWDAIQAAITAASDSSTPISSSNITALLTSAGTTAHTYFDASNSVMTDYVNNCISGASDAGAAVSSCVSSGSNAAFKKKVNAFRVAKVVASNSGSYTTSTLTSQILIDAGVTSGNKTYMDASYCGTDGTSSCLAKLRTKLAASNLTTASTQAQVVAKINDLMEDVFEDSADSASIPAPSSSPAVGCSTSTNLTLPWICSYSAYTCSKQAGPSEWSMNDANNLLVIPANYTGTGTKSVTIRASLNYSGSSYYKDYQRSYNVGEAVAASTQGYKWFTQGNTENPHDVKNKCSGKGGVWMTYDEVTSSPLSHPEKAFYSTGSAPCNSHGCWYGNSSNNIGFKQTGKNLGAQKWSGGWWAGGTSQNATTTHYACKDLPTCN